MVSVAGELTRSLDKFQLESRRSRSRSKLTGAKIARLQSFHSVAKKPLGKPKIVDENNVCILIFCNFVSYTVFSICTVAKKRSLGKPKIEDNRNLHFVFVFNCLIVFDSVALYSSRNNLRGITHKSPTSPNIAIYVCKHVHLVIHFSQLKVSLRVCLIRV